MFCEPSGTSPVRTGEEGSTLIIVWGQTRTFSRHIMVNNQTFQALPAFLLTVVARAYQFF
jgi:hypothetical protein